MIGLETIHTVFSVGAPVITLIGVAVSVLGTYLLTKKYHPWRFADYLRHLVDSPMFAMVLFNKQSSMPGEEPLAAPKPDPRLEELRLIVRASEVNPERGTVSLVGIDLIFIGFVLQAVGAVFSLVDVVWNRVGCS
jgi:hypothetical protein